MKPPTRSLLACLLVLPTGLSFQASPSLTERASISTSLKQLGIKEDIEFKTDLKDFSGKTYIALA